MNRQYKAFISYSWADKEWGAWAHHALETYRAPKGVADGKTLHPIFKDREEEAAGGGIGAAIEAALEASEFLIVLCSPASAASQWVNREVAWFKKRKSKDRILALVIDGEPGASLSAKGGAECFPKTLLYKVGDDLQPTTELEDPPLAADARPEGDGKRGAKLKLAAALLGVGLDALVKRDERRRAVRRRFVTGAAFALAGVLGALSVFAFNQRDAAVLARNDAVKARDDAEGLIELILTDLKSDLEGFGTLKSVTQIGNRAIGYYEGQDVKALSPDQLGRRARVLLMLGEADNKRGDLNAALARYETAAATTGEQLARDPENPQRMFDHAQSVFWVGYIAWQRGDRATAKRQFTEYHDLAQKLVASDPANEDWQAELDYAYSNLGTLAMDDGDAVAAEAWFRRSLAIALARLEKAPDDVDRVLSAGQAYAWLADALHRQTEISEARSIRMLEASLYDGILASEESARVKAPLVAARNALALAEILLNNVDSAVTHANVAVAIAHSAYEVDRTNTAAAERMSFSQSILSEALWRAGKLNAARNAAISANSIAEQMLALDGNIDRWRSKFAAQARLMLGRVHADLGDSELARQIFMQVVLDLKASANGAMADPITQRRYCEALAGSARLGADAVQLWREIIDVLGPATEGAGPEVLTILMEAYLQTGEIVEASRIRSRLYDAGYRHPDFLAVIEQFP